MRQKTIEEYLEIIYVLEKREGYAKNGKISLEMDITPPSVTEMLRKLQDDGYVEYIPYQGAKLTPSGRKVARRLMKRHQIIGDLLEIIGIERELAEIDACQIEHHVSEKTMAHLEGFVEFIKQAPDRPRWLSHFKQFLKTGKRASCDLFRPESSHTESQGNNRNDSNDNNNRNN